MTKPMPMVLVGARLAPELARRLDALARRRRQSRAAAIVRAIEAAVDHDAEDRAARKDGTT